MNNSKTPPGSKTSYATAFFDSIGQKAKNSLGANVFRSSSNNGPWDSGMDCGCKAAHRRSPSAPPLDLKGQFKFEFNNYLRSALTLRRLSWVASMVALIVAYRFLTQ